MYSNPFGPTKAVCYREVIRDPVYYREVIRDLVCYREVIRGPTVHKHNSVTTKAVYRQFQVSISVQRYILHVRGNKV